MNVDDVVAEKIAAARRRAEEAKRRRAALAASRKRGLAIRHAAKLRNLRGSEDHAAVTETDTTVGQGTTVHPNRGDTATVANPEKETH